MTHLTRWQEWAGFALGLWLAVSPWVLGYSGDEVATTNAAILGLGLALGSHFEASLGDTSGEWLNAAAGAWLVCSPFVLGYGAFVPTANCVATGTLAMALAASSLSLDKEFGRWLHKRVAGQ
jgi:SPW repeat-containing protein